MKTPRLALILGFTLSVAPAFAADLNVTGNITATGTIDSDGNIVTFGTQGASYGAAQQYADSTTDTLKFLINRSPASWAWIHNTNVTAMRLDDAHQLLVFRTDGSGAGITLTPGANASANSILSVGSATLTGASSGGGLSTNGALTVASGITNTNGTLTGGASGLSLNSGTAGTNLSLTAAGAGDIVFTTNSLERARIKSTGSVGIGTNNPGSGLLNVYQSVARTNAAIFEINNADTQTGYSYGVWLKNRNATNGNFTSVANWDANMNGNAWMEFINVDHTTPKGAISLNTRNGGAWGRRVYLDENGNLGVGTTAPGLTLDVNGPVRSTSGSIDVRLQAGAAGAAGVGSFSNDPLLLITAGTEKARITTSGNVGIGTASPSQKLTVNGASLLNGIYAGYNTATSLGNGTNGQMIQFDGNNLSLMAYAPFGNVGIGTTGPATALQVGSSFQAESSSAVWVNNQLNGGTKAAPADLYINYGSQSYDTYLQGTKVVVKSSGNVGIGTTTPATTLQVVGPITAGSGVGSPNGVDYLYGNYWGGKLFVLGSQYSSAASFLGYGVKAKPGTFGYLSSTTIAAARSSIEANAGYVAFLTGATQTSTDGGAVTIAERMRVDAAGNVGIGNTNPAYPLDVNGTVHLTTGNFIHNSGHGDYEVQQLPAANNGAGTGDVGLYSWVSEPYATWTGAGIARNMRNSAGNFPRVNTGLTGQMMRFDEGTGIWFTTETASGTRYTPMYLSGNDTIANGNVGIGTGTPNASLDIWKYYSAGTDSLRFSFNDGNAYWMGIQPYVVGGGNVGYKFRTNNINTTVEAMAITGDGKIGMGTLNPTHKLSVNGTIRAKEIIVDTGWADYVFDESYRLAPLAEVEQHIKSNKHLPGIPSAQEIAEHGVSMGDMQSKLLSKIEELTLHMIQQEKRAAAQDARIDRLEQENRELRAVSTNP